MAGNLRKLFAIFVFITLASIIFIIKVSIQTDVFKPPLPHTSRLIFALLRGYSWLDGHKDVCQPRTCANILRDGVRGYWKIRDGLTTENIAYRVDMDMKMRLSLKWPASLYRNDSRCGMKFPINGFRVQGNCDPDSETPCCDQKSGYCSSKPEICSCPECTDYRKLISAELADWVPTDPSCFVKNFTQEMTCELLNSHNISIAFIGDSIIRQLSRSLLLFVTGNRHSGIIPVNTSQSDRAICYEDHQITKRCSVKITAHKLEELEPNSVCKGNVKFKFDLVENYKKYLPQKDMDKIKEYLGRNNSFIVMSIGLHYRLDIEAVVREYLDKVLSLIETEGNGWPKIIWMGIHAVPNYLLTEPLFHNKGILEYNNKIHDYLNKRNVAVIDTFNLTKQLKSYDGLHYGLGANYQKMHILLNYLEEFYRVC